MHHLLLLFFGFAVMFATCVPAMWLGDRPAKIAGAACCIAWVASYFAQNKYNLMNPQYGMAAIDVTLLVVLVTLAIIYRRNWLVAVGGFQMLGVATHVAFLMDHRITEFIYLTAQYVWAYLTLLAVCWGTWSAWRQRRRSSAAAGAMPP